MIEGTREVTVTDLLPPERGPFEEAAGFALSQEFTINIAEEMNPYTASPGNLFWIAAHHGVKLWYDDWSIARQREIIAHHAGVSTAHPGETLGEMVGLRGADQRFLSYVDAEIIHKVSHPARFPVGRIAVRITPINHKPFHVDYLVKVGLTAPVKAICVGRTAVGRAAVREVSREPLRRAKRALTLSKAPATSYTVSFSHRVIRTLDDGLNLADGHILGSYRDRKRL